MFGMPIYALCIMFIVNSCSKYTPEKVEEDEKEWYDYNARTTVYTLDKEHYLRPHNDIKIYEFDDCQYVGILTDSHADLLSHRGNCVYCQARLYKMQVHIIDSIFKIHFP